MSEAREEAFPKDGDLVLRARGKSAFAVDGGGESLLIGADPGLTSHAAHSPAVLDRLDGVPPALLALPVDEIPGEIYCATVFLSRLICDATSILYCVPTLAFLL